MKISELITKLEELKKENGDALVYYYKPCCCAKHLPLTLDFVNYDGGWVGHKNGEPLYGDEMGVSIGEP